MSKKKETSVVVKKETKAVVVPENNVDQLLATAVEKGASVEVMERLFALHEKVQASKAKSAFTVAMSELQDKLPVIKKLKQGHVAAFAPIEDILEMTKSVIKEHGFSYRWDTVQKEKEITVVCIATHVLGHSDQSSMTSEVEEIVTGNASGKSTKSAPQRAASTITFLKRYTFIALFGIIIAGEDFDGRMNKQRGIDKKEPPKKTTAEDLMARAIKKIEDSKKAGEVISVDEYVQKDEENFSVAFKKKIKALASAKVTELENGK